MIKNCQRCPLHKTRNQAVPGEANPNSEIAFLGIAPGPVEDLQGKVFQGDSGKVLNKALEHNKYDRATDVSILNMVCCFPYKLTPDGKKKIRNPNKKELAACRPYLDEYLEIINPKTIVVLGEVPLKAILPFDKLSSVHGTVAEKDGRLIIPMYHPAAFLRNPKIRPTINSDYGKLRRLIDGYKTRVKPDSLLVDDEYSFFELIKELKYYINTSPKPQVAFDFETTGKNPVTCIPLAMSVAWTADRGYSIDMAKLGVMTVLEAFRTIFNDSKVTFIAHNANYELIILMRYLETRHPIAKFVDTKIAAHNLGESPNGLKDLAMKRLGYRMRRIEEIIGSGKNQSSMEKHSIYLWYDYSSDDSVMTLRLWSEIYEQALEKEDKIKNLYYDMEVPVVRLVANMRLDGMPFSKDVVEGLVEKYKPEQTILDAEIKEYAASFGLEDFNVGSTKQLAELLFTHLHLDKTDDWKALPKHVRITKSGAGKATGRDILQAIAPYNDKVAKIQELKELDKLVNAFLVPLPLEVNLETGRIHPDIKQAAVSSFRFSCADPNLQQIPSRTDRGKKIRGAFRTEKGNLLYAADFSNLELRILAHLSKDKMLIANYTTLKSDIHSLTASLVFGGRWQDYDKENPLRAIAKSINFALAYGAKGARVGRVARQELKDEARAISILNSVFRVNMGKSRGNPFTRLGNEIYNKLMTEYSGLRDYMEYAVAFAKETGYAEGMFGHRRYIPTIDSRDELTREEAEKIAINMPVQNSAADIVKIAMIELQNLIEAQFPTIKMIMQIHDELIFEGEESSIREFSKNAKSVLENPRGLKLLVPLEVTEKFGISWGDLH